jgi:hypothetical protein
MGNSVTTDDDRAAYRDGDHAARLEDATRAELDALRAHLDDTATWVQPAAELEERVVARVRHEAHGTVSLASERTRR